MVLQAHPEGNCIGTIVGKSLANRVRQTSTSDKNSTELEEQIDKLMSHKTLVVRQQTPLAVLTSMTSYVSTNTHTSMKPIFLAVIQPCSVTAS
jgi:hypothetical protein